MIILQVVFLYCIIGFLFAVIFLTRLIDVIDEAAMDSSWKFRLTIVPGCIVFWPVLLRRYISSLKDNHHG